MVQTERRSTGVKLTVYVVDVVNPNLLVIHHLPAKRKLITHAVGKRQGFSNPADKRDTGIYEPALKENIA